MSYLLPTLTDLPNKAQHCDGSKCAKCPLHKTWCHGCTNTATCGTMRGCSTECGTCHGEPGVQGVCCKSPLAAEAAERIAELEEMKFTPQPQLVFPDERIPILIDRQHRSPAPVNAISINRVYSAGKGWKSNDIKDYLLLDKSTKLIMTTVMTDDLLVRMAEKRWWETAPDVGIDYWQPMLWSMFMNESRMQRLYAFWQTMKSLSEAQAHFSTNTFHHLNHLNIERVLLRTHRSIPNVDFGLSHGSEDHDAQRRAFGYVKKYATLLGSQTSWFVQGLTAKPKQLVFKSLLPKGAKAYFFVTPLTGRRRTDDQYGWYD